MGKHNTCFDLTQAAFRFTCLVRLEFKLAK